MHIINAHQARKLANDKRSSNLDSVLKEIQVKSNEGEYKLHIYKSLDRIVLESLKKLDYKIFSHPSIDQQKENLYYTISW